MKHQKLKTGAMMMREFLDRRAHEVDPIGLVGRAGGVEQFVVDGVSDQRGGEFAEVLFERRGNGGDVEVRVGNIEVGVGFEAFFDDLDLGRAAGFAVDAFGVDACGGRLGLGVIGGGAGSGRETTYPLFLPPGYSE